jgi:Zn-dependent oligopeptidase
MMLTNPFASIQDKQAASAIRFSENVLDATNDFALFVDDVKELSGLPEDVIAAARAAAEQDAKSGYKFTLHFPHISRYCNMRISAHCAKQFTVQTQQKHPSLVRSLSGITVRS